MTTASVVFLHMLLQYCMSKWYTEIILKKGVQENDYVYERALSLINH